MYNIYRDIILEHWKNPQNYGVIEDADIDVTETNPLCGDTIRLMIELKNKKVERISFVGEGCAISKASASLFTEELKGKTIEELKKIKPEDVLNLMEIDLTPSRTKCALLIYKTLQKALKK